MIVVGLDATPLEGPPGGVRRMVEGWLAGFATLRDRARVVLLRGPSRRAIAARSRAEHVDALVSPWSAFPRVDVPVVVTVHELPFVRLGPVEGRLRALLHRRWLGRDVAEAAAILVPSRATRADVLALHPSAASRVHVVPHGIDPAPWRAAAESARAAPRPFDARPLVVAVGATSRRKGLDVLARAIPSVPSARFAVVGRPPRDVARALIAAGAEVLADVDDAALVRLVASATVLVQPSRSEGFGFPPLEAMAAGVPVVATRGGSVPEVVGDAALLVEPGDAGALADALRCVLDDGLLRARLVEAGRRRVEALSPAASALGVLRVVESVCDAAPSRARA